MLFTSCTKASMADAPEGRQCNVTTDKREDCGYFGINEDECVKDRNCCWEESDEAGVPWCFFEASKFFLCRIMMQTRQMDKTTHFLKKRTMKCHFLCGLPNSFLLASYLSSFLASSIPSLLPSFLNLFFSFLNSFLDFFLNLFPSFLPSFLTD